MQTSNFTPRASYKNRHKVLCLKNKDTFYLKKSDVQRKTDK